MKSRVALFCTNFLPYSQAFVYEEIQNHARYEVEVFAWRRFFPDRFPFAHVHMANPMYIVTRRSPGFDRVLRNGRFDLIHAHFGPGGTYARPFAARHRLPLVVTFHGYDVPLLRSYQRFLPLHWPYAVSGPRLLHEMTLGLCASNELRELLIGMGVPEARLVLCQLGVDLSAFKPAARDPNLRRVVMIGRFVEKKGFAYGVRAFALALSQLNTPTQLTIVGSGDGEAALRALVTSLGIDAHVRFAGVLKKQEVAAHGDRESGLIVVKEASASHVVPIGTYHGGIPEIIDDGETGFLVPERDVERMSARLATVLNDSALRQRLGDAARLKMEREYDIRRQVALLEGFYDQARARFSAHGLG
jgi:colanic acid/amylovoran biosynthesis glycosyltransferase